MRKIRWTDRARYRFDNVMSRGVVALIGWLGLLTAAFIIVVSLIAVFSGNTPQDDEGRPHGLVYMLWTSVVHALDEGTLAEDETGNIAFVVLMFAVTVFGIFIFSGLIGVLSNALDNKLVDLRKGRSFVVEKNHTIILGWSPQVFLIISELVIANENQDGACIVVMAEKDKVEMEDAIKARVGSTGRTRVVCRTGSPIDMADLAIVNPNDARAIIILSSQSDDPDALVIKTILALTNNPDRRSEPYHIVAEIREPENMEVAAMVANGEAILLPVSDLIARIAVQTSRQSGLSVVYIELLDFGGDEIYFADVSPLVGWPFEDVLFAYETSTVIGLQTAQGEVVLKPLMDRIIAPGDRVIAISEDDDTVRLSGRSVYPIDAEQIAARHYGPVKPERTLILGWNHRAPTIIRQLDLYVAPGSQTTVVTDLEGVAGLLSDLSATLGNQTVSLVPGSTTHRSVLESLDVPSYDHVITLSYMDQTDQQQADALTLITLLHLRHISQQDARSFTLVSEMLDLRNRELAEVTRADDFIVSDRLTSLMLSQLAENRALIGILRELFDPSGAELYLRPAADYVVLEEPVTFYTVVEAARRRDEIALGYRLCEQGGQPHQKYGVRVNPNKAETVTFGPRDRIIVLAEY